VIQHERILCTEKATVFHRFQEMDQQRKKQKVDLEAREAAALAGANRGGKGGSMPMGQGNAPGINTHVLDELRKLGQKQREEEAQRIEEALRVGERIPSVLSNCRDLRLPCSWSVMCILTESTGDTSRATGRGE
jgi:hypothetical protein